jgi:hypothetical protein
MAAKQKNIVLMHLESISAAKLWQYRDIMGTVWRLMESSLSFTRFQSAATSTAMAMSSVMTGDPSRYDYAANFSRRKDIPAAFPRYTSLAQLVARQGYSRMSLMSCPLLNVGKGVTKDTIYQNSPNIRDLLLTAQQGLSEYKTLGRPFYLYFWDASSHMAFNSNAAQQMPNFERQLAAGYSHIDHSFNQILTYIAELGLWDDTIFVVFGDHGDELWNHGLNKGYCHCTAPYATLCHTPFFIHSQGIQPGISSNLACTDDIRDTVYALAFPDSPPPAANSAFSGVNLLQMRRRYAFSHNMLPLQAEYSDPEKGLTKGYSIADGVYRLVVTTGGRNPDAGGMELFCDPLDPMNSRNLLDFFELDDAGEIARFTPPADAKARHFQAALKPPATAEIANAITAMKPLLRKHILQREEYGLRFFKGAGKHVFPEHPFRRAKRRLEHIAG